MRLQRPYIVIVLVVLVLIAGWTGYWFWLKGRVEQGIAEWIAARQAEGYEIVDGGRRIGGFPLRLEVTVEAPGIARPGEWRWQGNRTVIHFQPWNLQHVILDLGSGHHLEWAAGNVMHRAALTASQALASGIFDARGRLQRGALDLTDPVLVDSETGTTTAKRAQLHSRANHGEDDKRPADSTSLSLQLDEAALPPALAVPLGPALAHLRVDATMPPPPPPLAWRAERLEAWRAAGGIINLDRVDVRWGPLDANGNGSLALDKAMRPLAALSAELRNFGPAVDAYVDARLLKPAMGRNLKTALTLLAKPDKQGRPTVTLPITAQDGRLYLGPVGVADLAPVIALP